VGIQCVREALRAKRRRLHRLSVRPGRRSPALAELVSMAQAEGLPILERDLRDLDSTRDPQSKSEEGRGNPQGVELEAGALPELGLGELCDQLQQGTARKLLIALDGVEDPQNVGALARVAEVAGAGGLILTERRAPPLSPALARASAGAIEWLPVARVTNLGQALKDLRARGYWSLGADPEGAQSLYALDRRLAAADLAVVLGAEGRGLRPGVAKQLDARVRIPTSGKVASLNVSAAGSVLLFELQRRLAEELPPELAPGRRGIELA